MAEAIRSAEWTAGKTQNGDSKVKVVDELRDDNPVAAPLLQEIVGAMSASALFQREYLESAFAPRFSRYAVGGEYQVHSDASHMGPVRTDLAMTLFLNDDYEGGELCVDGALPNGATAMAKCSPGQAFVYECWRPHWVRPVTKGERVVVVTWLQSQVPNVEDREILGRLHALIDDLTHEKLTKQQKYAALGAVHTKLKKRFAH
jgi:PKHD-type hydroxylase